MNCTRLTQVLDGYLDGELDRATGEEIEQHLAQCPACTTARREREALRSAIRAHAPRYSAPASLKQTVQQSLAHPRSGAGVSAAVGATGGVAHGIGIRRGPTWLQAAALMMVLLLVGVGAGYRLALPLPDNSLDEQVVTSHVASLSDARRLTEVSSLDRHQVKPWFQGKVDFSPVVRELSAEGFELLGARLDHVGDRQAAAIVYRARKHMVNLFVWRARSNETGEFKMSVLRGFGIATWSDGGLRFAAVSDVESRELERFARLVQSPQS